MAFARSGEFVVFQGETDGQSEPDVIGSPDQGWRFIFTRKGNPGTSDRRLARICSAVAAVDLQIGRLADILAFMALWPVVG